MKFVLIIIGLFLFFNGVLMSIVSNFNLGIILCIGLGLVFLFSGYFWGKIKEMTNKGFWKWVKITVISLICIEGVLIGFLGIYAVNDNADYKEDAVIVLGAGIHGDRVSVPLAYRLNEAVEYHKQNPEAYIVVTGGQGFQESVTEAYAMEKYLVERGVNPKKIIKEEKATSTNENMRFSKVILDEKFGEDYSVVVITNNFHIYRGTAIAKIEGFEDVRHKHAGLRWYNLAPCYLRESLAVLKMWVFDMY